MSALRRDAHPARLAARYHLTVNWFHHPVYIAQEASCRAAIDEVLRYLEERHYRAVQCGPDELWRWWSARSRGRITEARADEAGFACRAACDYPAGFTLRIPCGEHTPADARCDGAPAALLIRREFGRVWAEVALPPGAHDVTVRWV